MFLPLSKMSNNNKTWLFYTSTKNATAVLPLYSKAFRDLQSIPILSNFVQIVFIRRGIVYIFLYYDDMIILPMCSTHTPRPNFKTGNHITKLSSYKKLHLTSPSPKLSKILTQFPKLPKMSSTSSSTKPLYHKHK